MILISVPSSHEVLGSKISEETRCGGDRCKCGGKCGKKKDAALSKTDAKAFLEIINSVREPNNNLKGAAEYYKKHVKGVFDNDKKES